MREHRSVVHYNGYSGSSSLGGSLFIDDTVLHPDVSCADFDSLVDNRPNEFRATEYIHHVYGFWDTMQVGVGTLSKHFVEVRVYWNNAVSHLPEILGDIATRPLRFVRNTHNRDSRLWDTASSTVAIRGLCIEKERTCS